MARIVLSGLAHGQSSLMEYNDFNELPAVLACLDTCLKKASSANPGDGFSEQGPIKLASCNSQHGSLSPAKQDKICFLR